MENKIIHYCWFGPKPISKLAKKCIASWKKYLPDYEIKLWNEENFDFNKSKFVKQAYESKKWAFVADYVRLKVLQEYGGIYFDTDMEIISDVKDIINDNECFLGVEDSGLVNVAVLGVKKPNHKFINEMVEIYDNQEFDKDRDLFEICIPRQITKKLKDYDFKEDFNEIQHLDNGNITVYPREYFYPLSYDHQNNVFTDKSCMIHHFDATWTSKSEKFHTFIKRHNLKFVLVLLKGYGILKYKIKRIIKRIIKIVRKEK